MEKSRTLALVCHATSPVFPQAGKIIAPARKDYCKTTYFRQIQRQAAAKENQSCQANAKRILKNPKAK